MSKKLQISDINIKRPKKRLIEKSTRNPSKSVQLVTKYTLTHNNLYEKNVFEDVLLSYRSYERNLEKSIRNHRSAIKLQNKYEILYNELQNRLHVDDPPDDIKAVTDIDDKFFKYLNNRRNEYTPLYKSLKGLYHKIIRLTQQTGYRRDFVLNMEIKHRREVKEYESSCQMYTEQLKQFGAFLTDDYEKSVKCLVKSQSFAKLIEEKITELKCMARKQFSIQSNLIIINYLYHQQLKYGRFLYYISPPSWRVQHRNFGCSIEIAAKGFDLGASSEEDTFNVIFENMKSECASDFVKPALYFSQPEDLMNIFESRREQQLHVFTNVAQLKPCTEMLLKIVNSAKLKIQNDTALVAHIIGNFGKLIDFEEERAKSLKDKFMKILFCAFYDSVAATGVLHLQFNLEWNFEKVFNEKSISSIGSTAKALENLYLKYTYEIDNFPNDEAKAALKESIEEEKHAMEKAHMAAKELRLFDRLEKALIGAYDTVITAPAPPVMGSVLRKSKKQQIEPVVRNSSQRELTEGEIEYLHLFTDWTEKENPAKYLQSIDMSPDVININ